MTQKGGTGKSTLAASVAVAAEEAGERVFLIDLDPQSSLRNWSKRRQADTPPVDTVEPNKLADALTGLNDAKYTLAIIDTAGQDTAATAAAMQLADLCLIPAQPSILDIEAAQPTTSALLRLNRKFAFVLNKCPTGRTSRPQDAANALAMMGALAHPNIASRTDHVDAMGLGQGVTERDTKGKAAAEIRQLWAWINKQIEGKKK